MATSASASGSYSAVAGVTATASGSYAAVAAQNQGPIVAVGATTLSVESGSVFTLSGVDSDVDGTVASRSWSLGGTTLSTTGAVTLTAPVVVADTAYAYTYSATDDLGLTSTATTTVTVRRAPLVRKNSDGSFTGLVLRQLLATPNALAPSLTLTTSTTRAPRG